MFLVRSKLARLTARFQIFGAIIDEFYLCSSNYRELKSLARKKHDSENLPDVEKMFIRGSLTGIIIIRSSKSSEGDLRAYWRLRANVIIARKF